MLLMFFCGCLWLFVWNVISRKHKKSSLVRNWNLIGEKRMTPSYPFDFCVVRSASHMQERKIGGVFVWFEARSFSVAILGDILV